MWPIFYSEPLYGGHLGSGCGLSSTVKLSIEDILGLHGASVVDVGSSSDGDIEV